MIPVLRAEGDGYAGYGGVVFSAVLGIAYGTSFQPPLYMSLLAYPLCVKMIFFLYVEKFLLPAELMLAVLDAGLKDFSETLSETFISAHLHEQQQGLWFTIKSYVQSVFCLPEEETKSAGLIGYKDCQSYCQKYKWVDDPDKDGQPACGYAVLCYGSVACYSFFSMLQSIYLRSGSPSPTLLSSATFIWPCILTPSCKAGWNSIYETAS
jgi:hypothetical protein